MRQVSFLGSERGGPLRLLLYESTSGVLVFTRASEGDGPCEGEHWFEDVEEAKEYCGRAYAVEEADWQQIPDPLPECQEDWVAQVRVKGRDIGDPQWGQFERFENGEWQDVGPSKNQHAG